MRFARREEMRAFALLLAMAWALPAWALPAWAQDSTATKPLRVISWSALKKEGATIPGTILPATVERPFEALRVENKTDKARTITVATLDDPGVTAAQWLVAGQVQSERAVGKGYLELLNRLTDGGTYFSRTLPPGGPMGWLKGDCGWRSFALPFNALKANNRPTELVVNVVLPQRGVVYLSPLELYQGESP